MYGRFTSASYRGRYKYHKPVGLGRERAPDEADVAQIRGLYDGAVASIDDAGRVQLVGQSELQFLGQLTPDERRGAVARLELEKISCVLVTKGLAPGDQLIVEGLQRVRPGDAVHAVPFAGAK